MAHHEQPIKDRLSSASTLTRLNKLLNSPWRYRCPEPNCRSSNIIVRAKASPFCKLYLEYQRHPQANTLGTGPSPSIADLRCQACNSTFDKPFDAKTEKRVFVRDKHHFIGGTVTETGDNQNAVDHQ